MDRERTKPLCCEIESALSHRAYSSPKLTAKEGACWGAKIDGATSVRRARLALRMLTEMCLFLAGRHASLLRQKEVCAEFR